MPITDPQPEQAQPVGEQIRDLRKVRGLTLQGLADKTGRSVGNLSQIERNISDVSIPVLKEIAEALDVSINWFFQGVANAPADERDIIVRADNRRRLEFAGTGMVEELLSPNFSGTFEMILGTFAPGAATGSENYSRTGEVGGYLIAGELQLTIGERAFSIGPGDAFTYPSTEPHRCWNPGAAVATVLWVVAPPSY
ncbi:MAG: helix-turn-helix transcriptional regulator [Rhodospirillales bacterium]|nr:helix-turn-helix transcriptional regulator [Rhodospirillales bacterium]